MKSTERHRLKENEFARSVGHARNTLTARRREIMMGIMALVLVIVALAGFATWRSAREGGANASLASALAVAEAPVVPPAAPAPGSEPPLPRPGTFQTEQARMEAALPKFVETADKHPRTQAGITARYHAAGILNALGRHAEAEQHYQQVVSQAGSNIYSRTGRLGLAAAQGDVIRCCERSAQPRSRWTACSCSWDERTRRPAARKTPRAPSIASSRSSRSRCTRPMRGASWKK